PEGNGADDTAMAMPEGMIERETERGERLAATGRHREREEAGLPVRAVPHMRQDLAAHPAKGVLRRAEAGNIRVETRNEIVQQACQWRPAPIRLDAADRCVIAFGILE